MGSAERKGERLTLYGIYEDTDDDALGIHLEKGHDVAIRVIEIYGGRIVLPRLDIHLVREGRSRFPTHLQSSFHALFCNHESGCGKIISHQAAFFEKQRVSILQHGVKMVHPATFPIALRILLDLAESPFNAFQGGFPLFFRHHRRILRQIVFVMRQARAENAGIKGNLSDALRL